MERNDKTPEQFPKERENTQVVNAAVGAPASASLDTKDGGSNWDPKSFVPPSLDDMPAEGPGSPGYDVYAPENAKWEHPELFENDEAVPGPGKDNG